MKTLWIHGYWSVSYLALVCAVTLLGLAGIELSKRQEPYPAYEQQIQAAQLMQTAITQIAEERQRRNLPLDLDLDPNGTGLIGREVTAITTTLGNLEAKRTSTNPAFAALLVRLFTEAGLRRDDLVAIGASGSFPALILATLAAADTLDLVPLMIYSVGASTYGANLPEFTFLDMLAFWNQQGLLPYRPLAVSLGGEYDQATGLLFQDSNAAFIEIAQSAGVPFIHELSLKESVTRRKKLYTEAAQGRPIACFINIGGADVNFGRSPLALDFPNGLVMPSAKWTNAPEQGLLFHFARRQIPIIHLLNIRDLALEYGLPVDPAPLPPIGEGAVYFSTTYNRLLILSLLGLEILLFWRGRPQSHLQR